MNASQPKVYTVTELTRGIKFLLEENYPTVWIEGEVSNLRIPSSGHMYFTLKDANSQIMAVMFRYQNANLKFRLQDGQAVLAKGKITLYEKSGQYQIVVNQLEPKGVGALQLAFRQLKEKLEKEGLFDPAHKKPIPLLPEKIGIVTSPTGAAIRDMLNVIGRRFANLHILVYPVKVQGDGASQEIAQAVQEMNKRNEVDVLIVGRGGGSLEDLWAFNEEPVARAIHESRIPVISAVGHEIDWTISDFVADLRVPTPSAAAELVVRQKSDFLDTLRLAQERMKGALKSLLENLAHRLRYAVDSYVFREPSQRITQYFQRVDDLENRLQKTLKHSVEIRQGKLLGVFSKLEVLNPLSVLKRGYSLTTRACDGTILRHAREVKKGEQIQTQLLEGTVYSKVEKIEGAKNG